MFQLLNELLGNNVVSKKLPIGFENVNLAEKFKTFFVEKVENINKSFENVESVKFSHIPDFPVRIFDQFKPVTLEYTKNVLIGLNKTCCSIDPFNIRHFDRFDLKLVNLI